MSDINAWALVGAWAVAATCLIIEIVGIALGWWGVPDVPTFVDGMLVSLVVIEVIHFGIERWYDDS